MSFSWHPYLPAFLEFFFFFVSLCFHIFLATSLKLLSLETFCLDISFVLKRVFILMFFSWRRFLLALDNPSFVLQFLQSTATPCTKYFPVLLRSKELPITPSTYFVLQYLHKLLPRTTLYYRGFAKYFPAPVVTHKAVAEVSKGKPIGEFGSG